jgi:hypothetical protein
MSRHRSGRTKPGTPISASLAITQYTQTITTETQHNTTQHNTTQHNTTQHNTTPAVSDIVGQRFRNTRCTNPLSPRYVMRAHSSLGFLGHPKKPQTAAGAHMTGTHQAATEAATTHDGQKEPYARPHSVAEGMIRDTKSVGFVRDSLHAGGDLLVTIGPVDRSHPGWRPQWLNRKEKDINLRNDDIPGMHACDAYVVRISFLTCKPVCCCC